MDYVVQPMIGNEVCVKKEEKPTKLRVIFDSAPDEETFKMSLSSIVESTSDLCDTSNFDTSVLKWTGYFFNWNNDKQVATYITPGGNAVRYVGLHSKGSLQNRQRVGVIAYSLYQIPYNTRRDVEGEVIVSYSDKKDLVNQLILIFSDYDRVQLDDKIMNKIDKLSKPELLKAVEQIDQDGRVVTYSCIKENRL